MKKLFLMLFVLSTMPMVAQAHDEDYMVVEVDRTIMLYSKHTCTYKDKHLEKTIRRNKENGYVYGGCVPLNNKWHSVFVFQQLDD